MWELRVSIAGWTLVAVSKQAGKQTGSPAVDRRCARAFRLSIIAVYYVVGRGSKHKHFAARLRRRFN